MLLLVVHLEAYVFGIPWDTGHDNYMDNWANRVTVKLEGPVDRQSPCGATATTKGSPASRGTVD